MAGLGERAGVDDVGRAGECVAQGGCALEVDDATLCGFGDVIDAGWDEGHRLHILSQQLSQDLAAGACSAPVSAIRMG